MPQLQKKMESQIEDQLLQFKVTIGDKIKEIRDDLDDLLSGSDGQEDLDKSSSSEKPKLDQSEPDNPAPVIPKPIKVKFGNN